MSPALIQEFEAVANDLPFLRGLARRAGAIDIEEAVQDAFVFAWRGLSTFRSESKLRTWLGTIVVNCARMQRRGSGRRVRLDSESETNVLERLRAPELNAEEMLLMHERQERLHDLSKALSPSLLCTLELRLSGLSIEEIASALAVPEGTVKARLRRARLCLIRLDRIALGRARLRVAA